MNPLEEPDLNKIVPDPKPCHFCVCELNDKADVTMALRVCCCPCHRQNTLGLTQYLKAVQFFFADQMPKSEEKKVEGS